MPKAKARARSDSEYSYSYNEDDDSGSSYDDDTGESSGGCSDEDDPREYKHGGYHPVDRFQLYNSRYRVLGKLGAGAFSTVWLCADEKESTPDGPRLVAMKVCKSKQSVTEQALDEIDLLERLDSRQGSPHVVQMLAHFWHTGPNGRHKCMAFEVMGENLLALVKHYDYQGLPVPMAKRLARHTLMGLAYIHSRGVIHSDLKLENVLIERHDLAALMHEAQISHNAFLATKPSTEGLTKNQKKRLKKKAKAKAKASAGPAADDDDEDEDGAAEGQGPPPPVLRQKDRFDSYNIDSVYAKLADFGNGCRTNKKVTDEIQTRQYRSPEVIIGTEWDETADVWSAACMFFELLTGDFLFDPKSGEDWTRDEDHLALMIELLGDHPPKDWVLGGKYSRDFFNGQGKLKHIKTLKFWPLYEVLTEKYNHGEEEATELADFLSPMLSWKPSDRQPAAEALKHSWVQPLPGEVDLPPNRSVDSTAGTSPVGFSPPARTPQDGEQYPGEAREDFEGSKPTDTSNNNNNNSNNNNNNSNNSNIKSKAAEEEDEEEAAAKSTDPFEDEEDDEANNVFAEQGGGAVASNALPGPPTLVPLAQLPDTANNAKAETSKAAAAAEKDSSNNNSNEEEKEAGEANKEGRPAQPSASSNPAEEPAQNQCQSDDEADDDDAEDGPVGQAEQRGGGGGGGGGGKKKKKKNKGKK